VLVCFAAVERPDAAEMCDAIKGGLGLDVCLEANKHYSRDFLTPGRVKVRLKDDDGNLCDDSIPNKQALMVKCAELCARHALRPKRLAELKRFEEQLCSLKPVPGPGGKASTPGAAKGDGAGTSQQASSKAGGKSNKKKGKKK
jgi:signal recognition particle subunit SRP19